MPLAGLSVNDRDQFSRLKAFVCGLGFVCNFPLC